MSETRKNPSDLPEPNRHCRDCDYWGPERRCPKCNDPMKEGPPGEPHEIPGEERVIEVLAKPGVAEKLIERLQDEEPVEMPSDLPKPLTFSRYMVEGGKAWEIMKAGVVGYDDEVGSLLYHGWKKAPEAEAVGLKIKELRGESIVRTPLPSTPATYALLQAAWCEAFGVKVGTRVRVVGKAADGELGWENCWVPSMDQIVGTEAGVCDIHSTDGVGVLLKGWVTWFPFHVLEPLPEPTASVKDGVWQMDISQAEGSSDDATCPLLEPLPAQPPAPTDAKGYDETGGESGWVIAGLQKQIAVLREAAVGARDFMEGFASGAADSGNEVMEELFSEHIKALDAAIAQSTNTKGES